jgi:hypothetical protein
MWHVEFPLRLEVNVLVSWLRHSKQLKYSCVFFQAGIEFFGFHDNDIPMIYVKANAHMFPKFHLNSA